MAPFIQAETETDQNDQLRLNTHENTPKFDFDSISSKDFINNIDNDDGAIFEDDDFLSSRIKDKKIIFIGLGGAIATLACILCYFLTSEKVVDIEELPIIKADYHPIKEMVESKNLTRQEDKKIYTYITAEDDKTKSKLKKIDPTISIKEVNQSKLTEADKKMILKAFEELAPNAKRRIHPVKPKKATSYDAPTPTDLSINNTIHNKSGIVSKQHVKKLNTYNKVVNLKNNKSQNHGLRSNNLSDMNIQPKTVKEKSYKTLKGRDFNTIKYQQRKNTNESLNSLINEYNIRSNVTSKPQSKTVKRQEKTPSYVSNTSYTDRSIYVQVASLLSMNDAKSEYTRMKRSHPLLNKFNYKIVPVRIGDSTRYRIMVGPFKSKDTAASAVQKMRGNGLNPLW